MMDKVMMDNTMMDNAMLKYRLLPLILLLISAPLSAALPYPETALGNSGELFTLQTGTYGELFASAKGTDDSIAAETSVLALDIELPGQEALRYLIPTSDAIGMDRNAWLVYDKRAGTLNVVWQETEAGVHRILLANFKDRQFSEVFEIHVGQPGAPEPSMALTRDSFDIDLGNGETALADRQILHLAWREVVEGKPTVLYSPVIFVEGSYVGWQETFDLTALWAESISENAAPAAALPSGLKNALSLEIAEDQKSVVIAFADIETAAVGVCKIGILPLELAYLSDHIRKQVLMQSAEFDPHDLDSFADNMRLEIIGMGARFGFHGTVVDYVADHVHSKIREEGGQYALDELHLLADELHDYAIDITASLLGVEVSNSDDGTIVEIDVSDLIGNPSSGPGQLLDLRISSELTAPTMIGDRPAAIYPHANGRGMLIAWQDVENALLLYVESQGDGWSEVRRVSMAKLSPEQADQLLRQRSR